MSRNLRWGILGTGNIARQFCVGIKRSAQTQAVAVGSRNKSAAKNFAEICKIPTAHGSYQQLIADPRIDAVYVALPNSLHAQWTIRALRAGKHVLCEKPIAMDAREAKRMFAEAKKCRRILMEAFMYRCHPVTDAIVRAVAAGAIGRLRLVRTSFCFRTRKVAGNVRFARQLGGGSLMDVGCYCINFARLFAGQEPEHISATARMHPRGVDEMVAGALQFPNKIIAQFVCSLATQANNTAFLCGDEGYIEIPLPWKPKARAKFIVTKGIPPKMDGTKRRSAKPPRKIYHINADAALYALEADAFAKCVRNGTPPLVTASDSIGNMRVLDEIRKQIGLNFE
jgi:xylose dehydrogenase (NAD/NADP)